MNFKIKNYLYRTLNKKICYPETNLEVDDQKVNYSYTKLK